MNIDEEPWPEMRDKKPSTGLPTLPEGQFWRVTVDDVTEEWMLQLRERRWFWSRSLSEREIAYLPQDVTALRIRERAEEIMSAHEHLVRRLNLLGDYPPKSLGGVS